MAFNQTQTNCKLCWINSVKKIQYAIDRLHIHAHICIIDIYLRVAIYLILLTLPE